MEVNKQRYHHQNSAMTDYKNRYPSVPELPIELAPSLKSFTPEVSNNDIFQKDSEQDEIMAIQALGELRNGTPSPPLLRSHISAPSVTTLPSLSHTLESQPEPGTVEEQRQEQQPQASEENEQYYDTTSEIESITSSKTASSDFLTKVKSHPFVSSAVKVYNYNKPTIKYGVGMVERAAIPMVNIIEQKKSEWRRKRRLTKTNSMFPDDIKIDKRTIRSSAVTHERKQRLTSISEALAVGNKNLNEFSLNMSIESKKRLTTCLQLLILANKQISSKISHLQNTITKEHEQHDARRKQRLDQDDEVFHDASNEIPNSIQIKQEIIGTVKKVVSLISKYAGNSLPEPARSKVRETLLRLPNKWATTNSNNNTSRTNFLHYDTNGKVLLLAHESLEMVGSIIDVFDDTLTKAELWVKKKQEKQLAKAAILNNIQQSSVVRGVESNVRNNALQDSDGK